MGNQQYQLQSQPYPKNNDQAIKYYNARIQQKQPTIPPPPPIPKCTYGNVHTTMIPNSGSCVIGQDKKTGTATLISTKYKINKGDCIGPDNIIVSKNINYVYNCPPHYSDEYEKVPETNSIVHTRIDDDINSIGGAIRDSGGNLYAKMQGPYEPIYDSNIPYAKIDLDSGSLLNKVINNDNIVSTIEKFDNHDNDILNEKAVIQDKFNDLYYTYIYKCKGDEKLYNDARDKLVSIADSNDDSAIQKLGSNLYTSKLVINDNDNNFDCNSLKTYVKMLNEYNSETVLNLDASIDIGTYNNNKDTIRRDYINLNHDRDDLDKKLRDLYNIPGYNSAEAKLDYDSTLYAGVIITIIASSLVYYAFTKI